MLQAPVWGQPIAVMPDRVLFELGREMVGLPTLRIVSPVEQEITVTWGEHIVDGGVRDTNRVLAQNFPVFCKYRSSNGTNFRVGMMELGDFKGGGDTSLQGIQVIGMDQLRCLGHNRIPDASDPAEFPDEFLHDGALFAPVYRVPVNQHHRAGILGNFLFIQPARKIC